MENEVKAESMEASNHIRGDHKDDQTDPVNVHHDNTHVCGVEGTVDDFNQDKILKIIQENTGNSGRK